MKTVHQRKRRLWTTRRGQRPAAILYAGDTLRLSRRTCHEGNQIDMRSETRLSIAALVVAVTLLAGCSSHPAATPTTSTGLVPLSSGASVVEETTLPSTSASLPRSTSGTASKLTSHATVSVPKHSASQEPTRSSGLVPSTSSSSTITGPTSTSESGSESGDRRGAAAAWTRLWGVVVILVRTPASRRKALALTVADDTLAGQIVASSNLAAKQGRDNYGSITHHIRWPKSISGSKSALIEDCQDQSKFGTMDTTTRKRLSVGNASTLYRGTLTRTTAGKWIVTRVIGYTAEECQG